jgi:hypothetical protein
MVFEIRRFMADSRGLGRWSLWSFAEEKSFAPLFTCAKGKRNWGEFFRELYGIEIRKEPGEGYYVGEESIREAVRFRIAFNVVDEASGYKADLIVRKDRPFSRTEFGRRVKVRILDETVEMATPEDVILSELEWARPDSQ